MLSMTTLQSLESLLTLFQIDESASIELKTPPPP